MSSLVLVLLAANDVCAAEAPAAIADPEGARAYLAVGNEELARGERRSAAAAFRGALRLDPSSTAARGGLERACRLAAPEDPFSQAVALMDAGDRRGAVERFEALRSASHDRGAALLEGICLYELGDDERARALLLEASASSELAASAELFLGLIALRRGEGAEAEARFTDVSLAEGALSATATGLRKLSARDGKLVVAAQLLGGYDSNVELAPSTSAVPSGSGDASAALFVSGLVRPLGRSGPYAQLSGSYRKQLELAAYDTGTASAVAGWQLARGEARVSGDYAFEFLAFGGTPYLLAHVLGLRGQLAVGPLVVDGEYALRFQGFLADVNAGYSGTVHSARLGVGWSPRGRWGLGAGYVFARDVAHLPELASVGHGPEVSGSVSFSDDLRLIASAGYRHRGYDAVDPDFGVTRIDDRFDASARLELDLGRHVTLFLAMEAHAQLPHVEELTYTRLAGWLGGSFSARVF